MVNAEAQAKEVVENLIYFGSSLYARDEERRRVAAEKSPPLALSPRTWAI
jgi:hypothetical protein